MKKDQSEGQHGYEKNPRLLELNPKGMVPTLALSMDFARDVGLDVGALKKVEDFIVLSESIDCIEILDAIAMKDDKNKQNLIPDPSFTTDAHRMNQNICSTFYKVLMKPTRDEQQEGFDFFASSIAEFLENVQDNGFYKSSCPTIVDFTVIPWILRIPLLRHYRPMFKLEEHMSKTNVDKLTSYVKRINGLSAVKKTLWKDEDSLIGVYKRYADGSATSQVGQAVRSGNNAHDV